MDEEKMELERVLQHQLKMLALDLENYYEILLRENQALHERKFSDLEILQDSQDHTKCALKIRFKDALIAALDLMHYRLDIDHEKNLYNMSILWQILNHPFIQSPTLEELKEPIRLLGDRIGLLQGWNIHLSEEIKKAS
jgi:hypothetical protein